MIHRIREWFCNFFKKRDGEYSKRLLNRIVNNSILMMWMSYVLAFLGMTAIAEELSSTIASTIIAVVVGYLVKSTVENISKYTDAFGKKDCSTDQSSENNTRAE
jgi:hypothetical protein